MDKNLVLLAAALSQDEVELQGKIASLVMTRLAILLPKGVNAWVSPCSKLAVKKFINLGARVTDSVYRGKIGVIVFNHSIEDFRVQVGGKIGKLILERIRPTVVQKVRALISIIKGKEDFGSTGL